MFHGMAANGDPLIYSAQTLLSQLGMMDERGQPLIIDGLWGRHTAAALGRFLAAMYPNTQPFNPAGPFPPRGALTPQVMSVLGQAVQGGTGYTVGTAGGTAASPGYTTSASGSTASASGSTMGIDPKVYAKAMARNQIANATVIDSLTLYTPNTGGSDGGLLGGDDNTMMIALGVGGLALLGLFLMNR